jgi:outer membrane protein TolC
VALDEAKAEYLRRKAVRLDATQEVVEARQELGFAMGLNAEEFSAAPTATGDFPGVKAVDWSSEDRKALAVLAMERRGDLGAARLNEQIQEAYLRRARNDLRPLVNLDVRTAYSGSAAGTNYDSVKDTLGNDLDGYNLTVGLSVGWPMGNRFARGEHRRRTAILREAESGTIELRNSVAATVAVATEALQSAVDQHAVAVEASAALARVVESQRSKVSSGEASITALVQNEDRYFEARAAEIQAARAYFSALAKLRLVTGTLVERKEDAYELASNAFEAPPRLP